MVTALTAQFVASHAWQSEQSVPLRCHCVTLIKRDAKVLPTTRIDLKIKGNGAWLSLARALRSGRRGRGFESHRPDLYFRIDTSSWFFGKNEVQKSPSFSEGGIEHSYNSLTGMKLQSSNPAITFSPIERSGMESA